MYLVWSLDLLETRKDCANDRKKNALKWNRFNCGDEIDNILHEHLSLKRQ